MRVIEIRSYRITEGGREQFHHLVCQHSLPLMQEWGISVLGFGPSLNDMSSYYLIRAFSDLVDLEATQAAFYASPAWRSGPRDAILALIESDSNVVMELSEAAIEALASQHGLTTGTCPKPAMCRA